MFRGIVIPQMTGLIVHGKPSPTPPHDPTDDENTSHTVTHRPKPLRQQTHQVRDLTNQGLGKAKYEFAMLYEEKGFGCAQARHGRLGSTSGGSSRWADRAEAIAWESWTRRLLRSC
jgi:hypothetical protein